MLVPDRSVPRVARYTWARQWRAEAFAGVVEGAMGLAAFTAMRSLGAGEWIASLFVTFGQLFWLVAPVWEVLFARLHLRRAFVWMGVVANAPLLAVALIDPTDLAPWSLPLFAGVVMLLAAVDAAYVPHRAALLRANYPVAVRGRLFAMLSTVSRVTAIGASKAAGLLLDADPRWLRVIFPAAGLAGLAERWTLSRIHWHREGRPPARHWDGVRSLAAAARDGWAGAIRILREDRAFRRYEAGFMLYGLGFLMSAPLVVVYAERDLSLSHDEWTWAQGFSMPAAYLLAIASLGRAVDRVGTVRTSARAFVLLAAFFAAMPFVGGAGQLVAAYALLGVAMAAVNLGWSLGPLEFAPRGMARAYSTVHVLCVGVRSAVAPFAGLWLAERTTVAPVFALSSCLVAAGCVTMFALARSSPRAAPGAP